MVESEIACFEYFLPVSISDYSSAAVEAMRHPT
jgi:hypothetical protein